MILTAKEINNKHFFFKQSVNGLDNRRQYRSLTNLHSFSDFDIKTSLMAGLMLSKIFNVSRIFGVFPFDNRFNVSKTWLIYSLLVKIINSAIMLYSICSIIGLNTVTISRIWKALLIVGIIDTLYIFIMESITLIYFLCKRNSLYEVFHEIGQVITKHGRFSKKIFRFVHGCLLLNLLTIMLVFFAYHFHLDMVISLYIYGVNVTSKACIVGQVWDLMQLLTSLVRDNTIVFQDSSINRLERLSSFGESIGEIYSPLLMMVVLSCFFRSIVDLYILLTQILNLTAMNFATIMSILLSLFYVSSIVYFYSEFINQVIEMKIFFLFDFRFLIAEVVLSIP